MCSILLGVCWLTMMGPKTRTPRRDPIRVNYAPTPTQNTISKGISRNLTREIDRNSGSQTVPVIEVRDID